MSASVAVQKSQGIEIAQLKQQVRGLQQMAVGGQVLLDEKAKDQEYWDTIYLLAGAGRQQIMAYRTNTFPPVGPQANQLKTKTEFNLPVPGTLARPQEYAIHGIRFYLMGEIGGVRPALADIEQIRAFCTLSYFQGERELWHWPLDKFSDAGFYGAANAAAAGGELNFGPSGLMDFEPFSAPLGLIAGFSFGWQITSAPQMQLGENVRMRIVLVGQLVTTAR